MYYLDLVECTTILLSYDRKIDATTPTDLTALCSARGCYRPQAADQLERRAIINPLTVLTGSYLTPDLEHKEQPMQIQHELAPLASKLWFGFDFSSIHCVVPGSGEPGGRFHP